MKIIMIIGKIQELKKEDVNGIDDSDDQNND